MDSEGFFCKLNYKGARDPKQVPPKVVVSIKVHSELYTKTLKTFEVKLVSGITIERQFRSGVSLASNQRSQQISVISVGDFDVIAKPEDKLTVRKTRSQGNEFSLSVRVSNEVETGFKGSLIIKNKYTDKEKIIPVSYSQ